jgi:hypothetical protein
MQRPSSTVFPEELTVIDDRTEHCDRTQAQI